MPAEICTHPWRFQVEPFRIAGALYYVGNREVSAHLLDTGDGLILIDTTYPQTVYLLLESIRRLGFDPAAIRYMLHSHAHYDHMGGTRALVELTGAETFLGRGDVEILGSRPELTWASEYGLEFHEGFEVDHPLDGGEIVALGDLSIECLSTPGHTPGAISYFFEVSEGGTRCRVGTHGGPGLNTLTRAYLEGHGLPPERRGAYLDSLARLKERAVDIFIGIHPNQSGTLDRRARMDAGPNPFVDPAAWPAFLEGLEQRARAAFSAD